jgi:DNA-binding transcriptional MocR family regulator
MSGAIFVASIARLLLPESRVGMIVSRKRLTDVITLAALAVGLLAAGFALPTPS